MVVKQVAPFVNGALGQTIGEDSLITEDLQSAGIIDAGTRILSSATNTENFIHALTDRIGKEVFYIRKYTSELPNVVWDKLEYGTVIQLVKYNMPDAQDTEDWQLEDGQVYEQNRFYAPSVEVKYYNDKITFTIPYSITDLQLRSAFTDGDSLTSFVSGLYMVVENAMTKRVEILVKEVMANLVAETVYADYGATSIDSTSGVKAVNLLYLYNDTFGTSLTPEQAIATPDFIRYACYQLKLYNDKIGAMSVLFNIQGRTTFTPKEERELAILANFKNSADVFLQSTTFHDELTALPTSQTVTYWQGTGTDFSFDKVSTIDVTTSEGHSVKVTGVLAVLYDKWSCGVCNNDHRIRTHRIDVAEFTNYWDKQDLHLFNDFGQNCVVFFVA